MGLFFTIKGELLVSWAQRKILGIDYALLPNREWNQKQKT